MRIGKIIGTALLCMAGGLMYAGIDDGLIFYCDYEGKADAAFASGDKKSKSAFTPEFQAGVRGQALVIGGKPETQIKGVSYSPDKNFNAEKGTISFWLKPVDWDGSSKGPNIILQTAIGKAYFQIYKYWSDDSFIFLIGEEYITAVFGSRCQYLCRIVRRAVINHHNCCIWKCKHFKLFQ